MGEAEYERDSLHPDDETLDGLLLSFDRQLIEEYHRTVYCIRTENCEDCLERMTGIKLAMMRN